MHLGPVGRAALAAGDAAATAFVRKAHTALSDCKLRQVPLSRTGLSASCDVGAGVDGLVIDASVVHVRRSLESEISAVVSELPAWSGGDGASAQKLAEFYKGDWAATRHVRCAISAVRIQQTSWL